MIKVLTYERFIELVPEETVEFVIDLLPYLEYYITKQNYIRDYSNKEYKREFDKKFLLMCNSFYHLNNENQSFLLHFGYNPDRIYTLEKMNNIPLIDLYNEFLNVFCIYENEYDYLSLTPSEILYNAINKILLSTDLYTFTSNQLADLRVNLELIYKKEIIKIKQSYEIELYKDLPIETIKYLEYISKTHVIIEKIIKEGKYNKQLITDNDEDLYILARIYALFFYKENAPKNEHSNYIKALVSILENNGLTINYLNEICQFNISKANYNDNKKPNILILEKYRSVLGFA